MSRFRLLIVWLSLFVLTPGLLMAQAGSGTVHGTVVDPDSALIPGATITLAPASGKNVEGTSNSDGGYTVRGIPADTYIMTVTAPGFAPYVKEGVRIAAGSNLTMDVKLAIEVQAQQVTVQADTVQLSVDPENNASSTTISGDALEALSDDPDELETELQALAGPSAGPSGGQIYIDGFTGGQLPPKSSILAIRINSNPFSAQYDKLGYGRIEIITKPGTEKYHGSASFQVSDKALNTSVPFLGSANSQPNYYTLFGLGNVTGPIRPGMSYSLSGSYRDIQNNAIVLPTAIYATSATSTTMCNPGVASLGTCASYQYPTANRAAPNPQTRWDISPRFDMLLGPKNTLTARFQYESSKSTNNGSGISLPSQGSNSASSETTLQLSDTQLWTDKIINESRFEYQRSTSNSTPLNSGVQVAVQGVVNAFGSGGGSVNSSTQDHYELQNYTSIQLTKNFVRLGARLRTTGEALNSNANNVGTIYYSYLMDPCTDPTITRKPSSCQPATSDCATVNTNPATPISSYECGIPFEFSQNEILNQTIHARQTDFEPYAEDDWKISPNLTWSYGVRLETQNFIHSGHDIAPRTSIAFGIPRKSGKTTTVIRAGWGIFYDRFGLTQIQNLIKNNGQNQEAQLFTYPGSSTSPCGPQTVANCTSGNGTVPVTQLAKAAQNIRSAYIMQSALTLEQQVGKYTSLSFTYLNARGEHQYLTRVFPTGNNYCDEGTSGSGNYVDCSQSEGVFRQNQFNTNVNIRTPKGTSIFGYYSANWANSNLTNITNPYVSSVDYGRASFAVRSRGTLGGTIPLPFLITASPLMFVQSGNPYSITTGVDNNLDGVLDDRPEYASGFTAANASCTNAADYVSPAPATKITGGETYTEIPINSCTSPAAVSFNLRLSRTFGFGPKTEATNNRRGGQDGGGPGGGPGGFGGGPGGGGRGGGGGGPRGGGGGGRSGTNTGHKYNLSLGVQAFNLFNEVPYGTPVSTLTSNKFGQYTSLIGGPQGGGGGGGSQYAAANAIRRITIQANLFF